MNLILDEFLKDARKDILDMIQNNIYNKASFNTVITTMIRHEERFVENRSILTKDDILDIYSLILRFCSRYNPKVKKYIKEFDDMNNDLILYTNKPIIFKIKDNIVSIRFVTSNNYTHFSLQLEVLGLQSKKLMNAIFKYVNKFFRIDETKNSKIYTVDGCGNYKNTNYEVKYKLKNLICPQIESIIDRIDKFFRNCELYKEYNKNYNYTLFLHGVPGTGKTTVVKAIASKYNIPIFLISNTSDLYAFVENSLGNFTKNNNFCILLFDDIDLILKYISPIAGPETEDIEEYKVDERTLYTLLQYLDGIIPYNNTINIMTTNYPKLIDKRILRAGRVDCQIEITNLNYEYAIKLCEKFNVTGNDAKKMLESFLRFKGLESKDGNIFNPSELEDYILSKLEV